MVFWRKKEEHEVGHMHNALSIAFSHVKRDVYNMFQWIHHFHKKHQEHDERLARIEQQIQMMPKSHQEIKQVVDYYYSFEDIVEKIRDLNNRLDNMQQQKQQQKLTIRERLVKRVTKGSKEYVKTVISSLIQKYKTISGTQLKEIVVEEQGLCSKSSFYRLLSELEIEGQVQSIQMGKEKEYTAKMHLLN